MLGVVQNLIMNKKVYPQLTFYTRVQMVVTRKTRRTSYVHDLKEHYVATSGTQSHSTELKREKVSI